MTCVSKGETQTLVTPAFLRTPVEKSAVAVARLNPKILDIRLIGTEHEPLLQITFVDGHELTYDTQHLQRFVSDTLDW